MADDLPLKHPPTPHLITLMDKLHRNTTEVPFSNYTYFVPTTTGKRVLTSEELYEILLYPNDRGLQQYNNLRMTIDDGDGVPACLPNFNNMLGLVDVEAVQQQLEIIAFENRNLPLFESGFFDKITDPAPQLDINRTVYALGKEQVTLKMDCYSDALQVFSVEKNLRSIAFQVQRYGLICYPTVALHILRLIPSYCHIKANLDTQKIAVWNARRLARPSLRDNLYRLFRTHAPMVLLITEARISKTNFVIIYEQLGLNMGWDMVESLGINSGTVLMWNKSIVLGSTNKEDGGNQVTVKGLIKVVANEESCDNLVDEDEKH